LPCPKITRKRWRVFRGFVESSRGKTYHLFRSFLTASQLAAVCCESGFLDRERCSPMPALTGVHEVHEPFGEVERVRALPDYGGDALRLASQPPSRRTRPVWCKWCTHQETCTSRGPWVTPQALLPGKWGLLEGRAQVARVTHDPQANYERRTFGRCLDGGLRRLVGLLSRRCGLAAAGVCATNFPPISTRCPLPPHSLHSVPAISPVPRQGSHGIGIFSFIGSLAAWRPLQRARRRGDGRLGTDSLIGSKAILRCYHRCGLASGTVGLFLS
jgi:hypothetical protein